MENYYVEHMRSVKIIQPIYYINKRFKFDFVEN